MPSGRSENETKTNARINFIDIINQRTHLSDQFSSGGDKREATQTYIPTARLSVRRNVLLFPAGEHVEMRSRFYID